MSKAIILIMAIICLLPMYILFVGSVTNDAGLFQMPPRPWPREWTLDHYRNFPGIGRWVINSCLTIIGELVLAVAIACATGYVFAFHMFPGKRILWALLLAAMMVPRLSLMLPKFTVLMKLELLDTRVGLVLSQALHPLSIYIARTFFETVPPAIRDAANIDGAGEAGTMARIVLPMSKPLIACLMVFVGTTAVGDYVWQSLVLPSPAKRTLVVGLLRSVASGPGGNVGQEFAAGVLMSIPLLVIFAVASRYFIEGLGGAVKE